MRGSHTGELSSSTTTLPFKSLLGDGASTAVVAVTPTLAVSFACCGDVDDDCFDNDDDGDVGFDDDLGDDDGEVAVPDPLLSDPDLPRLLPSLFPPDPDLPLESPP